MSTSTKTAPMTMVLTNNSSQDLKLQSCSVDGNNNDKGCPVSKELTAGFTNVSHVPGSDTASYSVKWCYSPDGGKTLLCFEVDLSGLMGITITPSKSGPEANNWQLSESPHWVEGVWIIRFSYSL